MCGVVGHLGLCAEKEPVTDQPSSWMAAQDLIWTCYDDADEWVVFDPFSADVHLLTASARLLWTVVSDGQPHAIEDLVATLAAAIDHSPDDELTRLTRDTLSSLDRVGLVRPLPP